MTVEGCQSPSTVPLTTIRGTIKNGQLVFDAEELRSLGLTEGQTLELPAKVLIAVGQAGPENPFVRWIGSGMVRRWWVLRGSREATTI